MSLCLCRKTALMRKAVKITAVRCQHGCNQTSISTGCAPCPRSVEEQEEARRQEEGDDADAEPDWSRYTNEASAIIVHHDSILRNKRLLFTYMCASAHAAVRERTGSYCLCSTVEPSFLVEMWRSMFVAGASGRSSYETCGGRAASCRIMSSNT